MFFRMIFGLPGAAFITGFLFVAMAWMIRQEAQPLPPVEAPKFDILAKLKPMEATTKPPQPKPIDNPEPPTIEFAPPSNNPGGEIPTFVPPDTGPGGGVLEFPTLMKPAVRFQPSYPDACRARGAQGVVIVEFDVTAEGAVVNPRIISSANSCFDRAVLNAIERWKYQPKQDANGRPVMQRGVREFFNFQLTD